MVILSTIYNIMVLPLFFGFGVAFNHDKPNFLSISAVLILLVSLFIKPVPHKENLRPSLSKPLYLLIVLIFLTACCDTILQGMGREALKQLSPVVFLGAFSLPTLTLCWIISKFHLNPRRSVSETAAIKKSQWFAIGMIPMIWFVSSIPEAFSLAAIPIYVFMSISVVTFLMDTVSDVIHKRIHINLQTVSFLLLVIVGISLSVLSV